MIAIFCLLWGGVTAVLIASATFLQFRVEEFQRRRAAELPWERGPRVDQRWSVTIIILAAASNLGLILFRNAHLPEVTQASGAMAGWSYEILSTTLAASGLIGALLYNADSVKRGRTDPLAAEFRKTYVGTVGLLSLTIVLWLPFINKTLLEAGVPKQQLPAFSLFSSFTIFLPLSLLRINQRDIKDPAAIPESGRGNPFNCPLRLFQSLKIEKATSFEPRHMEEVVLVGNAGELSIDKRLLETLSSDQLRVLVAQELGMISYRSRRLPIQIFFGSFVAVLCAFCMALALESGLAVLSIVTTLPFAALGVGVAIYGSSSAHKVAIKNADVFAAVAVSDPDLVIETIIKINAIKLGDPAAKEVRFDSDVAARIQNIRARCTWSEPQPNTHLVPREAPQ